MPPCSSVSRRGIAQRCRSISKSKKLFSCGASGSSSSPNTTVTVTATPPASASPGQTVTTPPAPSPPAAPSSTGPAACPTRDLQAKLGLSQGATGSTYQVIDFTNIGTVTCTLYGYPGVSLASGTPAIQIGQAATENPATPRQIVTLAPGGVANALLRIVHAQLFPAAHCHPVTATYLQIFPPNQTTPIYLAYSTTACSKPVHLLTIDVVKPGSGG